MVDHFSPTDRHCHGASRFVVDRVGVDNSATNWLGSSALRAPFMNVRTFRVQLSLTRGLREGVGGMEREVRQNLGPGPDQLPDWGIVLVLYVA